jgi:hypothetical protein
MGPHRVDCTRKGVFVVGRLRLRSVEELCERGGQWLRRRRFTAEPRVAQRTLGRKPSLSRSYPNGVPQHGTLYGFVESFQGSKCVCTSIPRVRCATLGWVLYPLRGNERTLRCPVPRVRCATLGYGVYPLREKGIVAGSGPSQRSGWRGDNAQSRRKILFCSR